MASAARKRRQPASRRWHGGAVTVRWQTGRVDLLTARSARVREARALTVAKHRRARGQFLAEGPQAVREALRGGQALELFVEQGASERWPDELRDARRQALPVHLADHASIDALSSAQTPQGIVAVCRWAPVAMAELAPRLREQASGHAGNPPVLRIATAEGAEYESLARVLAAVEASGLQHVSLRH